jgi:hypothetical protein
MLESNKLSEKRMPIKQFQSIEKLDTGILYALELASSIRVFLLTFR